MNIAATITLLWPALFCLSSLLVFLLVATQRGYGRQRQYLGATAILGLLILAYAYPPTVTPIRWGLTLIGFAAPVALSIVGIRYLIEET
ncbi:hypothetical protein BDK61_4685 [Haloarcula quadrata]|uniref:Uncharacterized protein n=1 Tax=Haloarcula quadrata TaxID=182779 RepID=A0A495QQ91_9EURY|nr:hypothetical protein [Haloarcula quadrata]RKS75144.1 hypothetical protein BDK61_4685 [Haloarcula quadrata]